MKKYTDKEYWEIIDEVFPSINECWLIMKQMGQTPGMVIEGMILGYLLGKGFSLEKSSIGKIHFIKTINKLVKEHPEAEETWKTDTEVKFTSEGKYEKL